MKKALLISLLILSITPAIVSAQYTALQPLPCIPGGGITCTAGQLQTTFDFQNYVQFIFNLIIAISAAASVFMIVYGGLKYMTTDSWTGKSEGLSKLRGALLGLLLVLTSYLILRTIDPRLVAIPTTLVAPLGIDYSKVQSAQSALDGITSQANQALQQSQLNANDVRAAQTALAQDQTDANNAAAAVLNRVNGVQADEDLPDSAFMTQADIPKLCQALRNGNADNVYGAVAQDVQVNELCNTYSGVADKQVADQSQVFVSTGKSSIDTALANCISSNTRDCSSQVAAAGNQPVNSLTNMSQSPQQIYDYEQYATGAATASSYLNSWKGETLTDSDYGQIIAQAEQPYVAKITDPATAQATQAKLTAVVNDVITRLGGDPSKSAAYVSAYNEPPTNTYIPTN